MIRKMTCALALATLAAAGAAHAADGPTPYPNSGTTNTANYSFTATSTGDLIVDFAGGYAANDDSLGVLINGVQSSAGFVADNKTSTLGESFDLGQVNAGDTLVFDLKDLQVHDATGNLVLAYSDATQNNAFDNGLENYRITDAYSGSQQHVFSEAYDPSTGVLGAGVPSGTLIAFEDKPAGVEFPFASDHDYNDEMVVFNVSAAPEPSVWLLMVAGVGMVGAALRRRVTAFSAA